MFIMRASVLCAVVLFIVAINAAEEKDYGIMIDAGSSGSRVYLYEWPHRDDNTLPLVEPSTINQTVVNMKISTPLASFAANPSTAGESLAPLLDYVKKYLPEAKWPSTPLYLKATAGMRAISESDQAAIIADVVSYFKTTPFLFHDSYAKVIPGTDEGIFGWITVNYILDLLVQTNPTTNGALDMGGASTQITYAPASAPAQFNYTFSLATNNFNLYTYSYPLGQDQAGRLLLAGLLADGAVDGSGNIQSPCYLAGYTEVYAANTAINATGTGNYAECVAAVKKYIVTVDSSCASCGIGSVYQPPVNGHFYAFSAFAYTYAFFGLSPSASINTLIGNATNYCTTSFADARAARPSENPSFLKNYCFTSTYLSQVLLRYGFNPDSTTSLTVQAEVNKIEVTWALGGMIYEANLLPFGPLPDPDSSAAALFVSLFSLLALLVL